MAEERTEKPTDTRGHRPIHEKMIPAAMIILVVISIGMIALAVVIALGAVGGT